MKGLALSFHSWRGLFSWPKEADLFHFRITLGFVTIWVCRFCATDMLTTLGLKKGDGEGK